MTLTTTFFYEFGAAIQMKCAAVAAGPISESPRHAEGAVRGEDVGRGLHPCPRCLPGDPAIGRSAGAVPAGGTAGMLPGFS